MQKQLIQSDRSRLRLFWDCRAVCTVCNDHDVHLLFITLSRIQTVSHF